MFRFNTETELYELYTLGLWSSFTLAPSIASVSTQVLKNANDSLIVSGSSLLESAQWRFIGNSKKQYIPKTITHTSNLSVTLVRPDQLPISDAPYQIQCRQMGKVAYFSPITVGNTPVFVTSGGLTTTGGAAITPFVVVVNDEDSGGITNVSITSGSLPPGLVGEFTTVGVNGKYTISGTPSTVTLPTTYPFTLTATDLGNNTVSQSYNIIVEAVGLLDGSLGGQIPVAAYSLRRLLKTYYGPQVKVRRSTDNFEADVYLNVYGSVYKITSTGGGTDWATWIAGRTLSVTTWYDQSGQANHMYCNPYPTLEFDSTLKTYYLNTNSIVGVLRPMITTSYNGLRVGNGAYSAIASFKLNETTSNRMLLSIGPANNNCGGESVHPLAVGGGGRFAGGACGGIGTWSSTSGITPSIGTYTKMVTTYAGGTNGLESIYVNSVLDKTANLTTNTPTSTANRFGVGWIRDDGAPYTMNAKIFNILFYNSIQLSASQVSAVSALLEPPAPTITSALPANITQSTVSALYTTSYTFTGTATAGSIVWSLTPTTFGNINPSTGALTLTFPQGTAASGTFAVTATDSNGSITQSWTYSINATSIPNDMGLWLDASETTTLTKDASNKVSEWRDKSANNRKFIQLDTSRQPTFSSSGFGTFPAVVMGASTISMGALGNTMGSLSSSTELTIFCVSKSRAVSFSIIITNWLTSTYAGGLYRAHFSHRADAANLTTLYVNGTEVARAGTTNTNGLFISGFAFAGQNVQSQVFTNGVSTNFTPSVALVSTLASSTSSWFIGDPRPDYSCQSVAEIIAYPRYLSISEQQQVMNFLNTKYAVY